MFDIRCWITDPASVRSRMLGVLLVAALLVSGLAYFRRTERTFADVI